MKMKNILKISISVALLSFGLNLSASEDYSKLDVKKECDVKTNGLDKVIQTAEKYNKTAIEQIEKKDKPTGEKVSIEFATRKTCSFAISALTQEAKEKKTWKLASP